MKRTLSGIASAAIVLGAISPMTFAATSSSSGLTPAGQLPIVVNGQVLSNPYEMVGYDSGNKTGFFPIYYFSQALAKIGIQATWNGVTHTWALTDSNVNAANVQVAGGIGTGNTTVTVNGTVVKKFNTQVARDPAAGPKGPITTYLPIYYINNILKALNVNGTFSGQAGLNIQTQTTVNTSTESLSSIQVSGQTVGTGADDAPAVASVGNAITFSTTVTDGNGNPVPNQVVQFLVSTTDNLTVSDGNGNTLNYAQLSAPIVIGNKTYDDYYQVTTNSQGVATMKVTSSASTTTEPLYVIAQLPIQSNGQYIRSSAVTAQWGLPGTLVLAPLWGNQSNPDNLTFSSSQDPTQGLIAMVATMLPESGQSASSVAGQAVKFYVSAANVAGIGNPTINITDSQGNVLSGGVVQVGSNGQFGTQTIYTTTTNSQGQAVMYLNANVPTQNGTPLTGAVAMAQVSAQLVNGGSSQGNSYLQWSFQDQPAKIANVSPANVLNSPALTDQNRENPTSGSNLTITGTAEDAAGNPVPNAQLVIVDAPIGSGQIGADGTDSYVVNGQKHTFSGSSFDLVTTDANGNFSFTVSDTVNAQEQQQVDDYYIYYAPATAGVVEGQQLPSDLTLLPVLGSSNGAMQVSWEPGQSVGALGISGQALQTSYSSVSQVPNNPSGLEETDSSAAGIHFGVYTESGQEILPAQFPDDQLSFTLNVPQGFTMNDAFGFALDPVGATYGLDNGVYNEIVKQLQANYSYASGDTFDVTNLSVYVDYKTNLVYVDGVQGYLYSNLQSATGTPFTITFGQGENTSVTATLNTNYTVDVNSSNDPSSSVNINGGTATLNINAQVNNPDANPEGQGGASASANIQFQPGSGVGALGEAPTIEGIENYGPLINTNSGTPNTISLQGIPWGNQPSQYFLQPSGEVTWLVAPFNNYVNLASIPNGGLNYTISSDGKNEDTINYIDGHQISTSDTNYSAQVVISKDGETSVNGQVIFNPSTYGLQTVVAYTPDGNYILGQDSSGNYVLYDIQTGKQVASFGQVAMPNITGDPMIVGGHVTTTSGGSGTLTLNWISGSQQQLVPATGSASNATESVNEDLIPVQIVEVGAFGRFTGTYTYTASLNGQSATAQITYTSASAGSVQAVVAQPQNIAGSADQTNQLTLVAQDAYGNPVPNATITITPQNLPGVWITAVNGVALQQSVPQGNTSQTEPTPVPLFNPAGILPSGWQLDYNSISVPGALAATNIGSGQVPTITLTTNNNGEVQLTLEDGAVTYAAVNTTNGTGQSASYELITAPSVQVSGGELNAYSAGGTTAIGAVPINWQGGSATVNSVTLGTFSTSSTGAPYDYSGTVKVMDAYGNPITGLTESNFSVSDNSGTSGATVSYTGVSSNPTAGDFTVSGGTNGVYTLNVYTSSDVKSDTLTVKVTQNGTSVTQTTTYSN
ncbi:hypothetical protein IW967_00160 [Alicyclobacillus mali]|uniref:Big-1 domain-containing protein n=1 Tax=Alicyclobacillus mali (ex Roth et al. 2021) TaxID=1123961 RepID=A0ABS0EYY1_9BACL|nr:hypothetical protein [Alicyclobacillus mali (ex Roth et al. 2021)]MBF8376311.1 hypothetical protein [Alicyclobacillus mali (ex Roth et al. 2021)]